MTIHRLRYDQTIPSSLANVWQFFSNPHNLEQLTPPDMKFVVMTSPEQDHIYPGQIVTYKVSPLLRIPLTWMTEITHVVPEKFFVDEQRVGPYRIWHHEHHFREEKGQVHMTDIVHYLLPFGLIGEFAHRLIVKKRLEDIFEYRRNRVLELFR